jgi:hypothetical protein
MKRIKAIAAVLFVAALAAAPALAGSMTAWSG